MVLKNITVSGYKSYAEAVCMPVKPLTLLYGQNSTGKSSLMRLLPLIYETLSNPGPSPLTLTRALTKSASFSDLFSKYRSDGVIEIALEFESNGNECNKIYYKFKNLERNRAVLMEFGYSNPAIDYNVELDITSIEEIDGGPLRYLKKAGDRQIVQLIFSGLIPMAIADADEETLVTASNVSKLLGSIRCYWLAPLRSGVPRICRVAGDVSSVGPFGEGCVDILFEELQTNSQVLNDVSNWFEANCSASLQVVPGAHEFGTLAGLALVRRGETAVRIPLEDCGEGITQVLPVLVLTALAKHGRLGFNPIIVFEHPDLHLHSNIHYNVVEFIVAAAKSKFAPSFLIESHAESMLVSAQLHLSGKQLLPEQLAAIHVRETDLGTSTIESVKFDSTGAAAGNHADLNWFDQTNFRALALAKSMVGLQ